MSSTAVAGKTATADSWGTTGNAHKLYYGRLTATADQTAESVGVSVTWYGKQCVNPTTSAKDPTQQYVLMGSRGNGCCGLGANPLSETADSQKEWAYLTDNRDLLTDPSTHKNALDTLPDYKDSIDTH